jgi:four helix bundle protein
MTFLIFKCIKRKRTAKIENMLLEELKVYQSAMEIGDECWTIVSRWNHFERDTIGKQLVRAADSIAANISEGFGRFHFKENRYFNFIARGSLFETKTWLDKAVKRNLITLEEFSKLKAEMNELGKLLNGYIKKIGKENSVSEPDAIYNSKKPEANDPFEIFYNDIDSNNWLPFSKYQQSFPFPND